MTHPGIELMHARTSVRKFTDSPVSRKTLETVIRAGMAAPTAGNKQPWDFIGIDDKKILEALAAPLPYASFTKNAPAAIVVCGNIERAFEGDEEPFWIQDAAAACQNILLACEALGLGAVWTGIHPMKDRVVAVSKILNLPSHVIPLALIPLGKPHTKLAPKDKWNPDFLHWQTW